MKTQILFIQGTGEEGYREDRKLVDSLQAGLGLADEVPYPEMPETDNSKDTAL